MSYEVNLFNKIFFLTKVFGELNFEHQNPNIIRFKNTYGHLHLLRGCIFSL